MNGTKYFEIKIRVGYDATTVPSDMEEQLRANVDATLNRGELLNDSNLEAVVDEVDVSIDEVTAR